MPITLKHINISDSDSIKLHKVNYNFDQLVANGGGPLGPQGSVGQDGPQGTTGQMGFQGPIGDEGTQGAEGPISENYWHKIVPNSHIDADRLVPICTQGDQFAPVVNIGYIESNPQYGTKLPLIGGKTSYQWNIHRRQYSVSNLRFENNSGPGGFDFKLEKSVAGKDQMTFGFTNYANSVSTYRAALTAFRGSASTDKLIISDAGGARFKTDTVFNSPVIIKRRLQIGNAGAATNKIAISEDNTGLVKFKSVQELGGTVPFGTIVSILPSIFADNTKFINSEQVAPDNDSPIEISVGKGIGNYEGWYLCNGKQWTDGVMTGPDLASYNVPKLGNFNYSIEDNPFSSSPNSQGSQGPGNFRTHITGGSNINMTATSGSTLVYNITSSVDTAEALMFPGSGTTFKIKQLPQIIYLDRNDLYWQDPGTGQAPSVPLTIQLDDANTTLSRLSPDPYPIVTITDRPEGASYSLANLTVAAPFGYYWSTIPTPSDITGQGYVTVQSITPVAGTYPTEIKLGINVNPHPAASPNPLPVTLGINTNQVGNPFISAASAQMQLNRVNTLYATVNLGNQYNIPYNFATGYSFTLIVTANSGYAFNTNPTGINSIVGGGTYTVTSNTLSSGTNGANTVLTLNITITGVPFGTTSLLYSLSLPIFSSAPRITNNPGNPYKIIGTAMNPEAGVETGGPGTNGVSIPVTVTNNTGGNVYIWAGIHNFNPGSMLTDRSVSGGWVTAVPPNFNISFTGPINTTTYSTSTKTLSPNNTITANLYRSATPTSNPAVDAYHTIRLYWSSTINPGPNDRFVINP